MPESCCRDNKRICQGSEEINGPPTKGPPVKKDYQTNEFLFTDGCYDKVMVHVERNALILGGVAAFVPLLLVGVIVLNKKGRSLCHYIVLKMCIISVDSFKTKGLVTFFKREKLQHVDLDKILLVLSGDRYFCHVFKPETKRDLFLSQKVVVDLYQSMFSFFLQIVGIVIVFCLCARVRKDDMEDDIL